MEMKNFHIFFYFQIKEKSWCDCKDGRRWKKNHQQLHQSHSQHQQQQQQHQQHQQQHQQKQFSFEMPACQKQEKKLS